MVKDRRAAVNSNSKIKKTQTWEILDLTKTETTLKWTITTFSVKAINRICSRQGPATWIIGTRDSPRIRRKGNLALANFQIQVCKSLTITLSTGHSMRNHAPNRTWDQRNRFPSETSNKQMTSCLMPVLEKAPTMRPSNSIIRRNWTWRRHTNRVLKISRIKFTMEEIGKDFQMIRCQTYWILDSLDHLIMQTITLARTSTIIEWIAWMEKSIHLIKRLCRKSRPWAISMIQ